MPYICQLVKNTILLSGKWACQGARAGVCLHSNKACQSMGNNGVCAFVCVMTVWCGGCSLQGVCSSSLGTEIQCKQLLQSANRTTRCGDHPCPDSNLTTHADAHDQTENGCKTHTHRGTHTFTQSSAWSGRGHTAETFMTLSDLISVWVCVSGGGYRQTYISDVAGSGVPHDQHNGTRTHIVLWKRYFTVHSIHPHPGTAACVILSPPENTAWKTPAQPVMLFVLV